MMCVKEKIETTSFEGGGHSHHSNPSYRKESTEMTECFLLGCAKLKLGFALRFVQSFDLA